MSKAGDFGLDGEELARVATVYRPDLLAGKTALISGAGSGIGKGIAYLFARLGADLVVCGRDAARLETTAAALRDLGARVLARPMTIRDPEQVEELFDAAWTEMGGIDFLVNNAGGQFPMNAIDIPVKGWKAVIDTNLNGTWFMSQTAARRWRDGGRPGAIVTILAPFWPGMPQLAHSAAARAGVAYLSRTLAVEWAPFNIRVNAVAPGTIKSSGQRVYPKEGLKTFSSSSPMMRMGTVHDVAEAVVYLAAPSAQFITGEIIDVDGGRHARGGSWPAGKPDYFSLGYP